MYRTSQPFPWLSLRAQLTTANSISAFLISLFLFLFTSSAAIACDASKGCQENMTVKYTAVFQSNGPYYHAFTQYQGIDKNAYIFDSESQAVEAVCSGIQEWVSDKNIHPFGSGCPTLSSTCPVDSGSTISFFNGPEMTLYEFTPTLSYDSCANTQPPVDYIGHVWTPKQISCLTEPYIHPFPSIYQIDQCWSCKKSTRRSSAPSFNSLNATGNVVSSNNHVLWYSPDACPVELVQNDPKDLACEGNPIACESGTKVQSEVDYQSPIDDGLQFSRSYNSPDVNTDNPQAFLGGGWGPKDNLSFRIIKDATYGRLAEVRHSKSPTHLAATLEDEAITLAVNAVRYLYVGSGGATTLSSSTPEHGQLKLLNGDWTWVTATGDKVVFGANGKPQRRELRGGRLVHYAWQEIQGIGFVLMSLTSDSGRQLQLTHNSLGQMVS